MRGLVRHPLHPVIVHFPLALWSAAAIFEVLALVGEDGPWWMLAWWNLLLGLIAALPAIASGFWELARLGVRHPALVFAAAHMMAMGMASGLFLVSFLLRGGPAPPGPAQLWVLVALDAAGIVCLAAGGWLGAELVYRHGAGRRDR